MVKDDFLNKKKSLLLALLLHFQQQAYHFESLGIYIGVSFQRRIKFMEFQFCPGRHLIAKKDNFFCCFFLQKNLVSKTSTFFAVAKWFTKWFEWMGCHFYVWPGFRSSFIGFCSFITGFGELRAANNDGFWKKKKYGSQNSAFNL